MIGINKLLNGSIKKDRADAGLIGRVTIAFGPTDVLTTEKLSAAVSVLGKELNENGEIRLCIDKPKEDTAGDMTINIYEECKVDGTNARDCFICVLTVEKIATAATYRSFNLSGVGYGTGNIKFGFNFATAASAWADATVYVEDAIVVHGGSRYRCISAHTSSAANDEPGVGTNWADKWELDTVTVDVALYRK